MAVHTKLSHRLCKYTAGFHEPRCQPMAWQLQSENCFESPDPNLEIAFQVLRSCWGFALCSRFKAARRHVMLKHWGIRWNMLERAAFDRWTSQQPQTLTSEPHILLTLNLDLCQSQRFLSQCLSFVNDAVSSLTHLRAGLKVCYIGFGGMLWGWRLALGPGDRPSGNCGFRLWGFGFFVLDEDLLTFDLIA